MLKSGFSLKEKKQGTYFCEYEINNGTYQPQQYKWVENEFIDDVLKGSDFLHDRYFRKPKGVWISGSNGWAEYCESIKKFYNTHEEEWLLFNRTPLKAYVNPEIRICEIHSLNNLEDLCQQQAIDIEPLLFIRKGIYHLDEEKKRIQEEAYYRLFWAIAQEYGGIHLSRNGALELIDVFWRWDCDSTVIFNPRDVKYQLLTREEIEILGWDKYPWIITAEQYDAQKALIPQ